MVKLGSRLAFLFGGFVLALGTMAIAQSFNPDFGTGNVGVAYMVQPDGSMTRVGGNNGRINDTGDRMIKSYAQELPAGSVIYRHGNKVYSLKNQIIDGKMCPEWEQTWTK